LVKLCRKQTATASTFRAQLGRHVAHRLLVERQQCSTIGRHALGHAEAQVARHQRLGPLHVDVVLLETVFPGDLERIAEALRRDQRRDGALAFDQGIGGQGRAVHDQPDIGRRAFGLGQDGAHALHHAALGRIGRGQDLDGMGFVIRFEDNVGERAANIDGEPGRHQLRRVETKTDNPLLYSLRKLDRRTRSLQHLTK
jgi:hypothetical protein